MSTRTRNIVASIVHGAVFVIGMFLLAMANIQIERSVTWSAVLTASMAMLAMTTSVFIFAGMLAMGDKFTLRGWMRSFFAPQGLLTLRTYLEARRLNDDAIARWIAGSTDEALVLWVGGLKTSIKLDSVDTDTDTDTDTDVSVSLKKEK